MPGGGAVSKAGTTSRAIALHVRTLELFSRMGVLEPILAEANRVRGAAVYANGRPLLDVSFEELDTPYPFAERMPVARDVLTFTDRMTAAATVQNPLLQKLRNAVLPVLSSLGPVQQRMMTSVVMLNIQYRHSPIVEQVGHTPGPHAGDHAPDLRLSAGSTLYEELDPTRHTLLLFSGDEPDSDAARQALMLAAECEHLLRTLVVRRQSDGAGSTLPDPDGEIHRQYGARAGTLCLVRPDGYLGFRGEAGDVERLRRYLERVFGPGR